MTTTTTAGRAVKRHWAPADLTQGERLMRDMRKPWQPPRPRRGGFRADGLDVGAWITWNRPTGEGIDAESVTGQVWAEAHGERVGRRVRRAVWALVPGERSAVLVVDHDNGLIERT